MNNEFVPNSNNNNNNSLKVVIGILIAVVVILVGYILATTLIKDNNTYDESIDNPDEIIEVEEDENDDSKTNNNDEQEINNVDVTADWKKYEVIINGKTISLPTSYNELNSASGFSYKDSELNSKLQTGYYTFLNMYDSNGKYGLNIEILNDTGSEKTFTECAITRITQTKYQATQSGLKVIFPGGLKVGDSITEEQIIKLFGSPDKVRDYNGDNYISKTYRYVEDSTWTTTNYFEIQIVNGVIDSLELDNRD